MDLILKFGISASHLLYESRIYQDYLDGIAAFAKSKAQETPISL